MVYYCVLYACMGLWHGEVDVVGLKPVLRLLLRSVLWHCWLGHLTRKNVPEMAYNVFSGMLNPAQSKLSAHANGTSIRSAVFAQTTAECLYCLQWFACFPLKIAPSHVGTWTSCNTWFIGPTRVRKANSNLIVSAVFAGLTSVTLTEQQKERQTDHTTRCDAA